MFEIALNYKVFKITIQNGNILKCSSAKFAREKNTRIWCFTFFHWSIADLMSLNHIFSLSPRFKKFGKIRLGPSCRIGPYLQLELLDSSCILFSTEYSWVQKNGLVFYSAEFHGWNWRIPGFDENKTQHWALFSTKTNQGRFYLH